MIDRSGIFGVLVLCLLVAPAFAGDDFRPINPAELAMRENPVTPGVSAVILEWDVRRNDTDSYEETYLRIKIFNDDGKKHADITIPFAKGLSDIRDVKARTIRPDGTVVPFTGKPFEKTIVKGRGFKVLAKTFSFPDVSAGSILEYRYREQWDVSRLARTRWVLQRDLPVHKAHFKLEAYDSARLSTSWTSLRLPPGKEVKRKGSNIELDLEDIPAFDEERYAPPEDELKPRVEFLYSLRDLESDPARFWQRVAQERYDAAEEFIGRRKAIQQYVETLLSPGDPAEARLRKLYARAQQIRNRSFERDKTEQEEKREKLKDNSNVEDVLKNGYGYSTSINRFFVAMARAAGFEAYPVTIGERDDHFLNENIMQDGQLDGEIAYVRAEGKEYFLDPGTIYCPFGALAWRKAGVKGIILSKNNSRWILTPSAGPADAITRRVAQLHFDDATLKGEVAFQYSGQEALDRRIIAAREDENEFRDDLETELKDLLPEGSVVTLKDIRSLTDPDQPLVAMFAVEIPDISSSAGSRRLVPLSIFAAGQKNPFRHEKRVHPVYFRYPFQELDVVELSLPPGCKVETLPQDQQADLQVGIYRNAWAQDGAKITFQRAFAVMGVFYNRDYYAPLRAFFDRASSSDQESAVLQVAGD
jgi:transglutaminase-like putative cysteine protease